jgi:hypothetical protein
VKDKKSVFYCPSCFFIATVVLLAIFEADATTNQQSPGVSNLTFSSTTTDAIDRTVRGMATNNIDKLMSETILPVLTNSSTSRVVVAGNNQTDGSSSDIISNNQDLQLQNEPIPANNARAITDNGTILLQFQNPTDTDIVNRLDKLGTMIQEYTKRNDVNSTVKSFDESNNHIIRELSEIKSSIGQSSSSNLLYGIISGAIIAGIVSTVSVFVLLRIYGDGGKKISELKLWRRNNSNYP